MVVSFLVVPIVIVLMDATRHSDKSTWELSSYSSKEGTAASTLVTVRIFHATAELSKNVLHTCVNLVCKTVQSFVIDCTYAGQIVQYAFSEVAL